MVIVGFGSISEEALILPFPKSITKDSYSNVRCKFFMVSKKTPAVIPFTFPWK